MGLKTGTIRQKVAIAHASPEEVYDAYMDAKKHAAFTGSRATSSPRVGGRMTAWDGYISARNVELVRGKRIVQEWSTTEWPKGYPPSLLRLSLRKLGNGTELTMVQSKVPAEQLKDYARGWKDWYWKGLRQYFGGR